MFFREKNSYKYLPIEILLKIYSHLDPALTPIAAEVSKDSNKSINLFWKHKYRLHFPHLYSSILSSQENINWYIKFRRTYNSEYSHIVVNMRHMFSLVKESDIDKLRVEKELLTILLREHYIQDKNGNTLLNWAQQVGDQRVLNYFYQIAQENLLPEDKYNRALLYWTLACRQDYKEICLLLSQGSKLDEEYFTWHIKPIHVAASAGHFDAVQALIENNLELLLEQADACAQTPLLWAAAKGHAEIVDYLIRKGANVNVSTNDDGFEHSGKTPLYWAASRGHANVVSKLLNNGAVATTALDSNKRQAIHIAAIDGYLDVIQTLIEKKPDLLEQVDAYGHTPLLFAAALGHVEILKYLISKDANLNVSTNRPNYRDHGKTPLCWAISNGHNEVVEILKHQMAPRVKMG